MKDGRVFDGRHYEALNISRAEVLRDLVPQARKQLKLRTALDIGCGLGYFSSLLHSLGFDVVGVDGRAENVAEARRRVPEVTFQTMSVEDPTMGRLGQFDLVICFGLLYHLENPFLAVRHLHALTSELLIVESVIFPGSLPKMDLVDEGPSEDQGLNHIAFYPTEPCLIKLMYRAGFPSVYQFLRAPGHVDFQGVPPAKRMRTMLAASRTPLQFGVLNVVPEPQNPLRPWNVETKAKSRPGFLQRVKRRVLRPKGHR